MVDDIVILEKEIAIKWKNKEALFVKLKDLRISCPCAWCSGEGDVFGNKYVGKKKQLKDMAFGLFKFERVGLYGIRFYWKDGHRDGIYTFEHLKKISKNA